MNLTGWKVGASGFIMAVIFMMGHCSGSQNVQNKWNKEKLADASLVQKEKTIIQKDEAVSRTNDREIANELAEIKASAAADVARIRGKSAIRVRNSEQRTAMYRAASEGGAVERANLASYASQLDRALAEGVGLVDELRSTLEVRDGQIRGLAAQIVSDRQLINGSGEADGLDEHAGR